MDRLFEEIHYYYAKWTDAVDDTFPDINHKKWTPLYLFIAAGGLLYLRFKFKTRHWEKLGNGLKLQSMKRFLAFS